EMCHSSLDGAAQPRRRRCALHGHSYRVPFVFGVATVSRLPLVFPASPGTSAMRISPTGGPTTGDTARATGRGARTSSMNRRRTDSSNAVTPLFELGVQFTTSGAWSGTAYVDSVSW